jgi:hypothetical protein
MNIFKHKDSDGDSLDVRTYGTEELRFAATAAMYLDVEAVLRLREALTDWIGDRDVTYPQPGFTTPSDVRFIVAEMLAQVRPLHQSPQAEQPDWTSMEGWCTIPGCDKFPGVSQHFEHDPEPMRCRTCGQSRSAWGMVHQCDTDPEPHDVGHPRPADSSLWDEDARPLCDGIRPLGVNADDECPSCDHLWAVHAAPAPSAPKQLVGCECGHGWGVHGGNGCHAEKGDGYCTCKRTPPSAS